MNNIQYTISNSVPIIMDKQILPKRKNLFKKNNNIILQQVGHTNRKTYKIPKSFGLLDEDPNKSTHLYTHFKIYLRSQKESYYLSVYRLIQKFEKNPQSDFIYEKICVKYLGLGEKPVVIKLDKSILKKIEANRSQPQPMVLKPLKVYCIRQLEGNYYKFKKSLST